jgi:hypothetical protein
MSGGCCPTHLVLTLLTPDDFFSSCRSGYYSRQAQPTRTSVNQEARDGDGPRDYSNVTPDPGKHKEYDAPVTASQEIGWYHKPLVKNRQFPKNQCDITKYDSATCVQLVAVCIHILPCAELCHFVTCFTKRVTFGHLPWTLPRCRYASDFSAAQGHSPFARKAATTVQGT